MRIRRSLVIGGAVGLVVAAAIAVSTASGAAIAATAVGAVIGLGRLTRGAITITLALALAGCMQTATRPTLEHVRARPLGVTGRVEGEHPRGLPLSLTRVASSGSDVVFRYDESVEHDHSELPPLLVVLVTSPLHLLGMPTGRDAVTASAELTVLRGAREIGHYAGDARVSQVYGLYYGSTLRKLEDRARAEVRRVIDEALYKNADNLAVAIDEPQP